jgi:hypothetical protein
VVSLVFRPPSVITRRRNKRRLATVPDRDTHKIGRGREVHAWQTLSGAVDRLSSRSSIDNGRQKRRPLSFSAHHDCSDAVVTRPEIVDQTLRLGVARDRHGQIGVSREPRIGARGNVQAPNGDERATSAAARAANPLSLCYTSRASTSGLVCLKSSTPALTGSRLPTTANNSIFSALTSAAVTAIALLPR